jgi:hypothetical protein
VCSVGEMIYVQRTEVLERSKYSATPTAFLRHIVHHMPHLTRSFIFPHIQVILSGAVSLCANAVITDAVNVYCDEEEPADVG